MAQYPVIGNLLADPEVRTTKGGKDVLNLRIAENLGYRGKDGWVETGTKVYDISLFEDHPLFENVADSGLTSGMQILAIVRDREQGVNLYETKSDVDFGVEGVGVSFTVDLVEIGASMRFATVEVTRNKKKSAPARKRRSDEDEDDAPKGRTSSRSRRNDDEDDDAPRGRRGSSRSRKDEDDEDDAPRGRRGSSRSRSSKSDDDF
jgi:single-stranded DNA-binding protein